MLPDCFINLFHLTSCTGNAAPTQMVSCVLLHAATSYKAPVHVEHGLQMTSLLDVQARDM